MDMYARVSVRACVRTSVCVGARDKNPLGPQYCPKMAGVVNAESITDPSGPHLRPKMAGMVKADSIIIGSKGSVCVRNAQLVMAEFRP